MMNAKNIVMAIGAILVLVGIIGFWNDPVFGIFEVDTLHNLVHLGTGAIMIWMAMSGMARLSAQIFGVVYGLVAVLGLVLPGDMLLGLLEVNLHDDILHLVLAIVFLYAGFMMKEKMMMKEAGMSHDMDMENPQM